MGGLTAAFSAGAVGGSTLVLVGMVVAATWLSGWYEERARRADRVVRRGARLRAGFGAIHGTARPVDGRPGGMLVATTRTQIRFGSGAWRDAGQVTEGSPFAVVLDGGEEIDVDAREAVVEGGAVDVHGHAFSRDLVSRVSSGDSIWVTGILAPRRAQGAGAYRSGMARARIGAPRGGQITLSWESPVPRWRALSAAHKVGAYLAGALGVMAHALFFRKVDVALFLRDQLACDQHLEDPHWLTMALFAGVLAVVAAAAGWRSRVTQARLRSGAR